MQKTTTAKTVSILFVCHGNICRSPLAEFLMKEITAGDSQGISFYIESAATSSEELGNPVYPPVRRILQKRGIQTHGKTARQIRTEDYWKFDYLIAMDENNIRNLNRFFQGDPRKKISRLLDWTAAPGNVEDPWYSGNFEKVGAEIESACRAIHRTLVRKINETDKFYRKDTGSESVPDNI